MRAVALWGLTEEVLASPTVRQHQLTEVEEQRAERFLDAQDKDSFRAAHLLVRVCGVRAGLRVGAQEFVQRCRECGGGHGVPRFAGVPQARVSLGHARGAVIAAVAPVAVGVDIEPARLVDPIQIALVLTSMEAAWLQDHPEDTLRIWCRKEAAVKASEAGLAGMAAVDTLADNLWLEESSDGFNRCVVAFGTPVRLERLR